LKDLEFDWAKDRQTEEREIEKLSVQYDSLEKYHFFIVNLFLSF
jgi:hypothetical protein